MVDAMVAAAQKWLNHNYKAFSGWVMLEEDGVTGWATMYGLRRALQAELGISPLASGFGPATTAAFTTQVGVISPRTIDPKLLGIVSAALWCKGYPGSYAPDGYQGNSITFGELAGSVSTIRSDLGLAPEPAQLDVKLVASLMSMDAYKTIRGGSSSVRSIQQWLNRRYLDRADFDVVPCDGVYSRQTQKSLLFALQYDMGMKDGEANGNFGPGTKQGIRDKALVTPGRTDLGGDSPQFVHLMQAALVFNDFDTAFDGKHLSESQLAVRDFQRFMELPQSASADFGTWCALLVASGDTDRATRGCDTRTQLTRGDLAQFKARGYDVVGRYLVGAGKFITPDELAAFHAENVHLVPIHQRFNNDVSYMTAANGTAHAAEAVHRARLIGLPDQSAIYFTVDFDAMDDAMGAVRGYFGAIKEYIGRLRNTKYRIGVYATRNVCTKIIEAGLAEDAYVAGMSNGYSGNMGFRMPTAWAYNQIVETTAPGGSGEIGIDKVVVSQRSSPVAVSSMALPGREYDGSPTETGFDELLRWVCDVEVDLEMHAGTSDARLAPMYIALALAKTRYRGLEWDAYFAVATVSTSQLTALNEAAFAIQRVGLPTSRRDAMHFAAAYEAYRCYGLPSAPDGYTWAALGGWSMDLLSLFGNWLRDQSVDLGTFVDHHLGVDGANAEAMGFGYLDLLADADAYLVAQQSSGNLWSERLRGGLGQDPPSRRIRRFGEARFGMSVDSVFKVLTDMYDGLDLGGVTVPMTRPAMLNLAESDRLPARSEREILATSLIRCLGRFS